MQGERRMIYIQSSPISLSRDSTMYSSLLSFFISVNFLKFARQNFLKCLEYRYRTIQRVQIQDNTGSTDTGQYWEYRYRYRYRTIQRVQIQIQDNTESTGKDTGQYREYRYRYRTIQRIQIQIQDNKESTDTDTGTGQYR